MKNTKGVTLVELIIVISVIGTLVIALGFSFEGWMSAYKVESQIKEMYVDLMNARTNAISRNRMYCVTLAANQYTVREDRDPAPDGDGDCNDAGDVVVLQKSMSYAIALTTGNPIRFTTRGLIPLADAGSIRVASAYNPDYDCIVVSETRINMGKWNGACVAK